VIAHISARLPDLPMISNIRTTIAAAPVLLCLLLLSACATTAPTQEMSDARQSVQAAFDAGAEELAPQNLSAARDYLERAERELELRFFNRARHDAMIAKNEAIKAHNISVAIRAAAAAIESSTAAGDELDEARGLLAKAEAAAAQGRDRMAIRFADDARRLAQGEPERR
jgi:hypothetical protein